MSSRQRPFELEARREQVTITWQEPIRGASRELSMSFGYARDGRLREIFCSGTKDGSELRALITDACIAVSHLLQRGATIFEIAAAFGEDREAHQKAGPPASLFGAIARKACEIIADRPYICPKTEDICTRMRGAACECEKRGILK
jgi:hypothetical protein